MEENPLRVVITGGPGSGKTTILNTLKKRGYTVFEEISREIIRHSLATGSDVLPWKNLNEFTKVVFQKRAQQYYDCKEGICFYDRSVVDSISYLPLDNLKPDTEMKTWIKNNSYFKTAFIAPPWREIYNRDSERKEDWDTAQRIYQLLCETYRQYGYTLIPIPLYTPDKRADFILKTLESLTFQNL